MTSWIKHDKSFCCPIDHSLIVDIETYIPLPNTRFKAGDLNWTLVKYYRIIEMKEETKTKSDGATASYYELPLNSTILQDLISHKDMNAQIGEIFRECYRYGQSSHSDELRGIKKIIFYANAELKRLENLK